MKKTHEPISRILDGLGAERKIVFLDEPKLIDVDFSYRALWEVLFYDFDVEKGVHTCGEAKLDELFDSDIDIISFDASRYDITECKNYRNEKRIAWGVQELEDVRDFHKGDLLTLPCGMSHSKYKVDDCEINLEKLIEIKKQLIKARKP